MFGMRQPMIGNCRTTVGGIALVKGEIRDFALRARKGLMEQVARRAEMLGVIRDGPGAGAVAVENQPGFRAAYDKPLVKRSGKGF